MIAAVAKVLFGGFCGRRNLPNLGAVLPRPSPDELLFVLLIGKDSAHLCNYTRSPYGYNVVSVSML
jgi:hypothetical protein